MRVSQSLALLLLGRLETVFATSGSRKVFESLREIPGGWEEAGVPRSDAKLEFRLALAPVSENSRFV
jgi:hypothetical protein